MGTKWCPDSPASEGETHCCQRRFVLLSSRPARICSKFKSGWANLKAAGSCSVPAVEAERRLTASRPPIGKNQRNGTTLARWRGLGGGGRDGMGWDGCDAWPPMPEGHPLAAPESPDPFLKCNLLAQPIRPRTLESIDVQLLLLEVHRRRVCTKRTKEVLVQKSARG